MPLTKVSVVIPTYNGAAEVRRAIDSALAQDGCEVEVIPVNDGSTDDTKTVLDSYGDRIKAVHQKNSGPAATRNAGIAAATGEWVAFLDHDDYWKPGKLKAQLEAAARTNADVIYTNAENFGDVNRVAELRSIPIKCPKVICLSRCCSTISLWFPARWFDEACCSKSEASMLLQELKTGTCGCGWQRPERSSLRSAKR